MKKTLFPIALALLFIIPATVNAQKDKSSNPWAIELLPINAATFESAFKVRKKTIYKDTYTYSKKNGTLRLPIANGKKVVFEDNKGTPYDEDRKSFRYLGQVKVLGCYLVEQHLFESTDYVLINKKTGKTNTLAGMPSVSPDGKILFNTAFNRYEEHADVSPPSQDVYLSHVNPTGFSEPYRISYNNMYITKYAWETNTSLVICYRTREEESDTDFRYARLLFKKIKY